MFERRTETWLSPIKKRKMDKGIEKRAATPIDEQANSNEAFSLQFSPSLPTGHIILKIIL